MRKVQDARVTREVQPFRLLHKSCGKRCGDIMVDFEKGWLLVKGFTDLMEMEEAGGAKRTHPKGTPERKRLRTKD